MPTYKNITIPKRGGGTRKQRVQVLKSGKYKFVKNVGKARASPKRKNKTKKRKNRSMARKKKNRRRRSFTLPLALIGGIMAMPAVNKALTHALDGNFKVIPQNLSEIVTQPKANMTPLLMGVGLHLAMSKLGVNRALGQARIPFIRF